MGKHSLDNLICGEYTLSEVLKISTDILEKMCEMACVIRKLIH